MTWEKGQSGNPKGRPKGRLNQFAMDKAAEIADTGDLPVEFLVSVFRDESIDMKLRVDAARAAAPFLHPRLSTSEIDLTARKGEDLENLSDDELMKIVKGQAA